MVKRTMDSRLGFLVVNKPPGMTSRRVVDTVKKLVKPAKVGHTGTLDPLAQGVLVVCVGPATRLANFVQQSKKSYVGTFQLGVGSDTDDIDSELQPLDNAPAIHREQLEALLPHFTGRIMQVPPSYSAIKVQGKRAYNLAREGKQVQLKARPVEVYQIELIEFDYPRFQLKIDCGAGTYIRSIGRDLGQRLGSAAIMTALTRTAVGRFVLSDCLSLAELNPQSVNQHLISPLAFFANLPQARLNQDQIRRLVHGGSFTASELNLAAGLSRIVAVDSADNLLALLRCGRGSQEYRIEINLAHHFFASG